MEWWSWSINLGCLCSKKTQKRAVAFASVKEVENLQLPECTLPHWTNKHSQKVGDVMRAFPFSHRKQLAGNKQSQITDKQCTKTCFWRHLRWEIGDIVTEYWFIFCQHCSVLSFDQFGVWERPVSLSQSASILSVSGHTKMQKYNL